MKKRIIEICDKMAEQGIKPTLERVRDELGNGSFSTINPILKQWKENRALNNPATIIDLPSEIAAIGEKAAAMIWKVANDQCNGAIKAIKQETNQITEQANAERDEALNEIKRLESENERLNAKNIQQETLIGDLKIKSALAEKADATINELRAELEKAQKEKATLEGMLIVYKPIEPVKK
jgi:chromosome segregation ATPase